MRSPGWIGLVVLLCACEPSPPEGRFACDADEDCPDAMVCRTEVNRCFHTRTEAETADASR